MHERFSVEIFRGCTRGCRFCQAGHDHPAGPRAVDHDGRDDGRRGPGRYRLHRGRACSRCPAPTTARSTRSPVGLADCYEGTNTGLSLPSTRVDAFNVTLADELSRNGRRSGPHLRARGRLGADAQGHQQDGHRGGPDPHRDDRLLQRAGGRSSSTSCAGCRPRPTRTCSPSPALAHRVIAAGRAASGRKDIRCTVSIGGFVPKPHTPFQWAAQCAPEVVDRGCARSGRRCAPTGLTARSIGFRYHDGQPSHDRGAAVPRRPAGRRR